MIGIYKITERLTGRCYIGQSVNIECRWRTVHKKRFSPELFDYEVLMICPRESLDFFERAFISGYDSIANGFNKTSGGYAWSKLFPPDRKKSLSLKMTGEGNNFFGKHHTDAIRAQISASKKGVPWSDARRQAQLNRRKNNEP